MAMRLHVCCQNVISAILMLLFNVTKFTICAKKKGNVDYE